MLARAALGRLGPDGGVDAGARAGGGALLVGLGGWKGKVGEPLADAGPSVSARAASVSGPGAALRAVGGGGSEERSGGLESEGCRSAGNVGPLGITGETSGLSASSPAHSESISPVSGALDKAREGRAASESNDGLEGTGPSEPGALGGAPELGVGGATGGGVWGGAAGLGAAEAGGRAAT